MIILICGIKLQRHWKNIIPCLNGHRVGLISDIPQVIHRKIDFDIKINSTMFKNPRLFKKPSPWMIWFALREMEVDNYNDVFLIGDNNDDELAALNAGIGFVHIKKLN